MKFGQIKEYEHTGKITKFGQLKEYEHTAKITKFGQLKEYQHTASISKQFVQRLTIKETDFLWVLMLKWKL